MDEKKMTDKELVKALEYCAYKENGCSTDCPLIDIENCTGFISKNALDLIHRLQDEKEELKQTKFGNWKVKFFKAQAEIERLTREEQKTHIIMKKVNYESIMQQVKQTQKETAEKFAEYVKMAFYYEFDELIPSIMADKIDEIAREITDKGVQNGNETRTAKDCVPNEMV